MDILKGQYATDVFTTEAEARVRSMALGLDGVTHVSDYDGQAVYMPAASHEAYLAFMETEAKKNIEGKILKTDDEQRLVWGWASVVTEKGVPVIDRQGDVISPDTIEEATTVFMEHVRVGKAMHTGEQVGLIIHSFPVTEELCGSLGIQSDREGWIVAYKVYDDDVWSRVKSGELAAFSIGGKAIKEEI